jgi:hypothetical protein
MEILKMAVRGQNRAALPVPKSVRVYPRPSGAATECTVKTGQQNSRRTRKSDGKTPAASARRCRKAIV